MKRLQLDRVWWLVTPGNPLKDTRGLAPLAERIALARSLAQHPRIDITDLEAEIGTRYTHETILYLRRRCPGVHFVWIMGADNLRSFHRWQQWRGHRRVGPDRRRRSARAKPLCDREPRRPGARALPRPRECGMVAGEAAATSLGLPARAEIAPVLNGFAGKAAAAKAIGAGQNGGVTNTSWECVNRSDGTDNG